MPEGNARDRILAATLDELNEAGPQRASLRSIARRVGITHQAVAHYFPDRTALFTQVAADGFGRLLEASSHAVAATPLDAPAGSAVRRQGEVYVRFARSAPLQFQLMFGSNLVDSRAEILVDARRKLWQLTLDTVAAACAQGWGAGEDPQRLALVCWSTAHGLAVIEQLDETRLPSSAETEDVIDLVARAFG